MRPMFLSATTGAALFVFAIYPGCCASNAASSASAVTAQAIAKIVPGHATKADVQARFGRPWRVVQFNDCGAAMDDQADETWEYRGNDESGPFRLHIEFGDNGVVHLIAKIPDNSPDGKGTVAKVTPPSPSGSGMSM